MEEALLQLASKFLFSDVGKKIIGDNLDIDSYKSQINSQLQDKINSIKESTSTSKTKLSREERKKLRQDKRDQIKEVKQETKDKIQELIPEFRIFKISGRVYDKISKQPVEGVKVKPLIEEPIYLPFGDEVTTQTDGKFIVELKIPILPLNNKSLVTPVLLYTKSSFLPSTQSILTGEREVKSDLSLHSIVDIKKAAEEELPEYIKEANDQIKKVNDLILSLPEKVVVARRKSIMKVVDTIQGKLFPLALTLLIAFGITKLSQRKQKICPTEDLLKSNIERRNRIVRQLNQIYKTLAINTALAGVLIYISSQFKTGRLSVSSLPIPLIGADYSSVSKLQEVEALLKELEEQNKDLNKQILIALIFLVASLIIIYLLLKGIDELTQECAGEMNLDMEPFSQELTDLTQEASEEGVVSVSNINGFTLEVQSIDQSKVGGLTRRQAVGKNPQGVIMVKGDPSFSSSDQILINELAYYIQSNDLKAY